MQKGGETIIRLSRLFTRPLIVVALALGLLIGAADAPAAYAAGPGTTFTYHRISSTGGVAPDSSSGCAGGQPFYQWELCMIISGSGNYVNYFEGASFTYEMSIYGHLELHGPDGYVVNSPNVVWNNYTEWNLTNYIDGYMATGTYCVTWWEDVNGTYDYFTSACENVE